MIDTKISIVLVAGARPNFMKVAPIIRALEARREMFDWKLVHTGQHYDEGMSAVFFRELGIPEPAFHMGAGGGSHATQTARIMIEFERFCERTNPDLVMVVGDVNSTLACSIVAKKVGVTVAHVEAGLRSGDRSMPEEINRLVTDSISDLFFVTEQSGEDNLVREGHDQSKIHFVGHVMIDNLFFQLGRLEKTDSSCFITDQLKRDLGRYGVVTLHRPSNVDSHKALAEIIDALATVSKDLPLVFPIHPRTANNLAEFSIKLPENVFSTGPLPYMEFLNLWKDSVMILTDSGGVQEESTALQIPCITIRQNTERPVTVTEGTNILAGTQAAGIVAAANRVLTRSRSDSVHIPKYWDGRAAERIVEILIAEASSSLSI